MHDNIAVHISRVKNYIRRYIFKLLAYLKPTSDLDTKNLTRAGRLKTSQLEKKSATIGNHSQLLCSNFKIKLTLRASKIYTNLFLTV